MIQEVTLGYYAGSTASIATEAATLRAFGDYRLWVLGRVVQCLASTVT